MSRRPPTRTSPTNALHARALVDVAAHRQALQAALATGTAPAGRLLGLPELPDGGVWCDTAAVSVLAGVAPSTITSWLTRGKPTSHPFPPPDLQHLYRDLWRRSSVQAWLDGGGSPYGNQFGAALDRLAAAAAAPAEPAAATIDSFEAVEEGGRPAPAPASAAGPAKAPASARARAPRRAAARVKTTPAKQATQGLLHTPATHPAWAAALNRASTTQLEAAIATLDSQPRGATTKLRRLRAELTFRRHLLGGPTEQLQRLRDLLSRTPGNIARIAELDAELARRTTASPRPTPDSSNAGGDPAAAATARVSTSRQAPRPRPRRGPRRGPDADATTTGPTYTLTRSTDPATGAWHVEVDGEPVGQVRPVSSVGRSGAKRWEPWLAGGLKVTTSGTTSTYKTRNAAAAQVLMAWQQTQRRRRR